jgi:hypothetical protein
MLQVGRRIQHVPHTLRFLFGATVLIQNHP